MPGCLWVTQLDSSALTCSQPWLTPLVHPLKKHGLKEGTSEGDVECSHDTRSYSLLLYHVLALLEELLISVAVRVALEVYTPTASQVRTKGVLMYGC